MAAALDLEQLYRQLGSPGRFQVIVCLMLYWNIIPIVVNHLAMAIFGTVVPHHCKVPEDVWLNESLPAAVDNGQVTYHSCKAYRNFSSATNKTMSCPIGWEYLPMGGEKTIVSEFDLVCDDAYLSSLATTIYFCGVMVGGIFFGSLSDRYGRKPFMLITLYLHALVGVAISFAPSYIIFVVLRFVLGILMQGLHTCTFVLIMELFPAQYRTAAATIMEIFWGFGVILLAVVSYLVEDWRYIQLTFAVANVFTLIFICVIPESIRWLLIHDKPAKAEKVIKRISRFNKVPPPLDVLKMEAKVEQINKYSILDMFRTPELRKRSMILFYLWTVVAVGYYGLSLSITSLAGNKYFNLLISGIVELPAYCIAVYILKRFGRRRPLCIYLLIGGVLCIAAGLVPSRTASGKDIWWLPTSLAIMGRFGMAGCFSVILLYTSELFPTVIRNVSVGTCMFWGRLGGVLAPQVLQLGLYTFKTLPVLIFGVVSLIGGLVTCLLPETLNMTLPDTIEQAEGCATPSAEKEQEMATMMDGKEGSEVVA